MKTLLSLLTFIVILFSCNTGKKSKSQASNLESSETNITLLWISDSVFKKPESILYDSIHQVLYVSNIQNQPWGKDGDGFISKVDLSGNVISLKWVEGMDAPKGMGLVDSVLYIADIDKVMLVNVNTGDIIQQIKFDDEDGLNDITTGEDGEVYVSSSSKSRIYKIKDGLKELVLQTDGDNFNGLYFYQDKLYALTSKTSLLLSIDIQNNKMDTLATEMGLGDGLEYVGGGCFIASDWFGQVFYIDKNLKKTSLLNTKDQKINSADIEYLKKEKVLLVPTFNDNRIVAYKLIKE